MGPDKIRSVLGFAGVTTSVAALLSASPSLAQGGVSGSVLGAAPIAIAIGAAAFGVIAGGLIRNVLREGKLARAQSARQVAELRAMVDEYEAMLSGAREVIVLWGDGARGPRFLGQTGTLLPAGRRPEAVLDFSSWLADADAAALAQAVEALRVGARAFEQTLRSRDGRTIRAFGTLVGNGTALRLRPAAGLPQPAPAPAIPALLAPATPSTGLADARAILTSLPWPAFLRDPAGRLVAANAAWHDLAYRMGRRSSDAQPGEIIEAGLWQRSAEGRTPLILGDQGRFEPIRIALEAGSAGYLKPVADPQSRDAALGHLTAIINALGTPIAIFNGQRELVQCNAAYAELWQLDPRWLTPGLTEDAILDRLRTAGRLPNEPDYKAWRTRHLTSYQLDKPTDLAPWHLPDGRTVQIIAAPAGAKGGVIYVYEDLTTQLNLMSQHKALLDVQRSTLNALTEAVAVFGTNGRLTLSNPRLSTLWRLPENLLAATPHIDQLAEAAAVAMPEDGAIIWADLKRAVIDLTPRRSDKHGRITRADGKLVDYAVVRLPDGQSMLTFLDVTESANYQRVLKEKNEALLTADRLKDAFVQNVSYELRSPLTNIIGFADLLDSGVAGELNERQRAYTEYIRASSGRLGMLIDNILDLATVDAGIAELRPERQDVQALVDKACAGIFAEFPEIDGKRSIDLKVEIGSDLPPFIADGTRILQVLYSLLSNAARFSEPGGTVKLTVTGRPGRMLFVVDDEGAPMSEDRRSAMVDRAGLPASGRQRGADLGLAIVRAFVSLHGGTITIDKREPRGTRVTVSLPSDAAFAGAAE